MTITSTNGAILDGNDIPSGTPVLNINANLLALSAFTGIGRTNPSNPAILAVDAPLETQVNSLEAKTATGGIFITNSSLAAANPLNIGGVTGAINGVQDTGASGDIVLMNNGSINIITFNEIVKGPGNVSVTATGAGSDVFELGGGNNFDAIVSTGGTTTITAGRDVLICNLVRGWATASATSRAEHRAVGWPQRHRRRGFIRTVSGELLRDGQRTRSGDTDRYGGCYGRYGQLFGYCRGRDV